MGYAPPKKRKHKHTATEDLIRQYSILLCYLFTNVHDSKIILQYLEAAHNMDLKDLVITKA